MKIIGAVIFCAFLYFGLLPFIFGGKKMENLCRQITLGMSSSEIYQVMKGKTRYRIKDYKKENQRIITIIDTKAMGRFICGVSLKDNKVVEAKYIFND